MIWQIVLGLVYGLVDSFLGRLMKCVQWNIKGISSRQKQFRLWHTCFCHGWDVLCAVEHKQHKLAGKAYVYKGFHVFYSGHPAS